RARRVSRARRPRQRPRHGAHGPVGRSGPSGRRHRDAHLRARPQGRRVAAPRVRRARRAVVHRAARPGPRRVSARTARWAIAALSLVGVAITSYLLYTRYSGTRIACPTGGCETVQHSRYAKLGGIPVAGLGLAGYLALLATTFVRAEWARAAAVGISL